MTIYLFKIINFKYKYQYLYIPKVVAHTADGASKSCSRNRRNEAVKSRFKSSHCIKADYLKKNTNNIFEISFIYLTFFVRDIAESDSSVEEDCPPTLLISPQTIGLSFV